MRMFAIIPVATSSSVTKEKSPVFPLSLQSFTAMANLFVSFPTFCFFVPSLLLFIPGGVLKPVNGQAPGQGAWCVPKPSSSDQSLINNIAYACNIVDCSLIQPGGSCFEPNNNMNHASVVMNLYYQQAGRNFWNCDFNKSGIIAVVDPSYGDCKFQYKA